MKILQFNPYQCGAGQVGSKKSKPILTPPRGVGLKSRSTPPHPTPPPLRGGKTPYGVKWGVAGQVGQDKIAIHKGRLMEWMERSFSYFKWEKMESIGKNTHTFIFT